MDMFKAYQQRDKLNEKMILLLLQSLRQQRVNYEASIVNYPPERMEKYGRPFIELLNQRISEVEKIIQEKFPNAQN